MIFANILNEILGKNSIILNIFDKILFLRIQFSLIHFSYISFKKSIIFISNTIFHRNLIIFYTIILIIFAETIQLYFRIF